MFNRTAEEYHIYRYDRATHTWGDTGTLIDERNSSKADTLWDGSHLYVASAGVRKLKTPHGARILRYSYDPMTKTVHSRQVSPSLGSATGGWKPSCSTRILPGSFG